MLWAIVLVFSLSAIVFSIIAPKIGESFIISFAIKNMPDFDSEGETLEIEGSDTLYLKSRDDE